MLHLTLLYTYVQKTKSDSDTGICKSKTPIYWPQVAQGSI